MHKKEVAALKQQLDKLLEDLGAKSEELRTASSAQGDMKRLLQQVSESHCSAERELSAQVAALRADLELKTQELRAEAHARAEAESMALQKSASVQGQGNADGQLAAALRQESDTSVANLQAVQAELGANQQLLAGRQQEVEMLRQELAGKQQEVQAAAHSYAELEELVSRASEEQSMAEDKLMVQLTAAQDEVKELRGVHCACEALEQTVLHLKQRLGTEATKQAELAGKRNSLCSLEL
ncbi:hypothetical protein ABBQ38_011947 [Trebouxia sp. C0009 RCD-2024]